MKGENKLKKVLITTIILMLLTVGVAALTSNTENISEPTTDDQTINEEQLSFETSNIADRLRGFGYYSDEINIVISKLSDAIAVGNMSETDMEMLFSLAAEGYDFEKLVDIYNFIRLTDKDISFVKQIYDEADGFEDTFWIENAYEKLTVSEEDMLTIEDMYQYTDEGLSVDDILMAYEMSFKGNIKIKDALDARVGGESWQGIAVTGYDKRGRTQIVNFYS